MYSVALQGLNKTGAELDVARQSASNLGKLAVYLSVTFGQSSPLLEDLSSDGRQHHAQQLVTFDLL